MSKFNKFGGRNKGDLIKTVNIIGAGNVGYHLMMHLNGSVTINAIYSRNIEHALKLSNICRAIAVDDLADLEEVDLNIVCVSDDAIGEVAAQLSQSVPVVHTGGAVSLSTLERFEKYGIMYPLQTFSVDRTVDMTKVPFLLEASSESFGKELADFVNAKISPNALFKNSKERKQIHLAAVFLSNFTVQMIRESANLLSHSGHSEELLKPLLEETIQKVLDLGPDDALTGPAKREDNNTIDGHLAMLKDSELRALYELVTNRIKSTT